MSGDRRVMLRASELAKTLGGRPVVDRVSLEVRAGEVVGLLGPNGAGKSTVFNLIMGLLRPDQGRVEVRLGGTDADADVLTEITGLPPYRRALAGLGYLPQGPSVFGGLTVAQNLEAVLQLRQGAGPDPADLLESFGLAAVSSQKAATLSGGERRRLELAKLVAGRPRVLLLDEPLAGLDPLAVADFLKLLEGLGRKGIAILLTDHSVVQALTICTRAYILVDGSVLVSGSNREVTEHDAARRLFWGAGAGGDTAEQREAHGT